MLNLKPWSPGNVVAIPLGTERYAYGRVIEFPLVAFYDLSSAQPLQVPEVIAARVAFRLWVAKRAIGPKCWQVVGNAPLELHLLAPPEFFNQDPVSGELTVYCQGVERPASLSECGVLERAAVWSPQHVEARLRDHFAGVPNKWSLSLRPTARGA